MTTASPHHEGPGAGPRSGPCQTAAMDDVRARLSSATTSLTELVDTVSATAESALSAGDESTASDLFEVERSLRTALRRLTAVARRPR